MDTILYSVLRITVMILILRTLFRLFAYPKTKSFRFNIKQRNQEISPDDNDNQEPQKKEPSAEMVIDKVHGSKIAKKQAYIILDSDNNPVYFSSWDDRQAYVENSV